MAKEEFEIEVDKNGSVTIRTIGIKGPKCVDAAEVLVKLIGREETRKLTSEYYEEAQQVDTRVDVRQRH